MSAKAPGRSLVAAVASLALGANAAGAAAPPDSVARTRLQAAIDSASYVRVTSTRGEFQVNRLRFDAAGVLVPRTDRRAALIVVGDPSGSDAVRLLAWSDVERIDAARPRLGRGLLVGMLVGAACGGLLVAVNSNDLVHDATSPVAIYLTGILTLGGGAAGLLIGAANPQLRPVFP